MLLRKLYYLNQVMKQQWMKPKDLERIQERMLRKLIFHAYKYVPYYRRKWKQLNIRPEDIKSVEDLKKLPIITRDEIKRNIEDLHSTAINLNKCISRSTSGSSGSPLTVHFDEDSWDYLEAVYARALFNAGYKPWNRLAYYWHPPFNKTKFYELFGIMKKYWFRCTIPENQQIENLKKINPEVIYCYPSTLYLLSKIIEEENIEDINPKLIISHGEVLTQEIREYISSVFNCEIFDQYGSTEFNRMGWECEMHDGFHIDSDSIIIEFLELGQKNKGIIVTGLVNKAMPIIRYNNEDLAYVIEQGCTCEKVFPKLKGIEGRSDDLILTPSGRIISPRAIVQSLMHIKGIWKFRVIQGKTDSIDILIVGNNQFSETTFKEVKNKMGNLAKEEIDIQIKIVEDIPRNKHGKLRSVESKVKTI